MPVGAIPARIRGDVLKKRILAVDDDPNVLSMLEKVLRREGYEVMVVQNGTAAISMFSEREFDLILLDVMMPGVDGFEVSRTLRQADKPRKVPVVFITAKDDAESMREGFRSGGSIFISKPFTATQLTKLVRSLIGG